MGKETGSGPSVLDEEPMGYTDDGLPLYKPEGSDYDLRRRIKAEQQQSLQVIVAPVGKDRRRSVPRSKYPYPSAADAIEAARYPEHTRWVRNAIKGKR